VKTPSDNTVLPVWDESIEMEVQVSKYDLEEEILSEASMRVHEICEVLQIKNKPQTIKTYPGKCC
jgi:hypothetical protein